MNCLGVLLEAFFSIQITHCKVVLMMSEEQLARFGMVEADTQVRIMNRKECYCLI